MTKITTGKVAVQICAKECGTINLQEELYKDKGTTFIQ
jgi:hypothetical protein